MRRRPARADRRDRKNHRISDRLRDGPGMKAGARNLLTDVAGLRVGNATDAGLQTGTTIVTADAPFVAGVHIMGGAPGTRETDLLAPGALVPAVDALVLSGGSAFGLAAADGAVEALRAAGRGFEAAGHRVPIVPAAILFDLDVSGGEWTESPYPALGREALRAAGPDFALGSVGAGAGATVAGLKGGLGSASAVLETGETVAALVAVNATGAVTCGAGPHFWAAPFELDGEFGGLGPDPAPAPAALPAPQPGTATTLAVVATDAALDKAQAGRLAHTAHDGIARAVVPAHTPFDGDLVFAAATGARPAPDAAGLLAIGHAAATCLARAIARAVYCATPGPRDTRPVWSRRRGG